MKLQAKDLRIGNLVNYRITDELDPRKEWVETSEIEAIDLVYLSKCEDDNYQPIPG